MARAKSITIGLMLATFAVLVGWDIVAAVNSVAGDTISEVIQKFSYAHPVVPLGWGVLGAHFFWRGRTPVPAPHRYLVLAGIAAVAAAIGLWGVWWLPLWPFLAGIPTGRVLWPQFPREK